MGVGFGVGLGLGLACRRGFGRRARTVEIENEDLKTEKNYWKKKERCYKKILTQLTSN